jgi:clan AA aspartic protease
MGMVYEKITLKNVKDEGNAQKGFIRPENIRTATVMAVVDTGSMHLVITEELRKKLGLEIQGEKIARIANGLSMNCKMTDAVEVHWKDREMTLPAMVIPGAQKVLLGALALEGMDLMVDPTTQKLVGAHGDREETYALSYSDAN